MNTIGILLITVAYLVFLTLWVWGLVDCIRRKDYPKKIEKLFWILFILFLNWLGVVVYFYCKKKKCFIFKKLSKENFLSKEEYLDHIKNHPDLYVWKTYEDYLKNSNDGIPLVKIPKKDIKETKKVLKKDFKVRGMTAYNEMLMICLENTAAIFRVRTIAGTKKLQYIQNFIIRINRLLLTGGVVLLIISIFSKLPTMAVWGVIILILDYFLSAYLQTEINFEIAARLVSLDKLMGIPD